MVLSLQILVYSVIPLFFSIVLLAQWLSTPADQPPSPPKLPVIGNLHQLGLLPHRSLQSLAQKYGHLMLLRLGSAPLLVVSSEHAAREIMKTHDVLFSSRPKSSITHKLLYGKDMAFAPYGAYWRQIRSIAVFHLLSNKRVQSLGRVREAETRLMMEKIGKSCSVDASSPVDLSEMFISLANGVVCRVALGSKYGESEGGKKAKEVVGQFIELLGVFNVGDYIPWLAWLNRFNGLNSRVERVAEALDRLMETVIQEHVDRQNRKLGTDKDNTSLDDECRQDFVDVLLAVQRDNNLGVTLHKDSLKALILDMFIAGTETTSTALEWTMTELVRHPHVMKKLQEEVRKMARGKRDVREEELEQLHYLKAVIKESMRLHPSLPLLVPRESTHDAEVLGYKIASGTQAYVNAWAIQRDPKYWKEAEKFLPERFLDNSIDFNGQNFHLMPFGAGRRSCPGAQFAMALYELALANLVCKFDFKLPGGLRGEELDVTEAPGIAVHKKYPLVVVANPCSV